MAADKLGITRKSSSSWFPNQVVEGAKSREQHWKSGKAPLTPAFDKIFCKHCGLTWTYFSSVLKCYIWPIIETNLFSISLCQSSSPKLREFVQYFQVIPLCPKCPQDGSCFAIMKPGKSWYFIYPFCLHRTVVDQPYYTIWVHSLG